MHVIGHDDKSLDFDAGKMIGNVDPTGANYVADRAERTRPFSILPKMQRLRNAQIVTKYTPA